MAVYALLHFCHFSGDLLLRILALLELQAKKKQIKRKMGSV
jgi:hypothetical protein